MTGGCYDDPVRARQRYVRARHRCVRARPPLIYCPFRPTEGFIKNVASKVLK